MNYSGNTLLSVIKSKKIRVSDLARLMNVSRGTIYNWFKQDQLPAETIHEIGHIIEYDFTIHLTDLPTASEYAPAVKPADKKTQLTNHGNPEVVYKEKYLLLLSVIKEYISNEEPGVPSNIRHLNLLHPDLNSESA